MVGRPGAGVKGRELPPLLPPPGFVGFFCGFVGFFVGLFFVCYVVCGGAKHLITAPLPVLPVAEGRVPPPLPPPATPMPHSDHSQMCGQTFGLLQ